MKIKHYLMFAMLFLSMAVFGQKKTILTDVIKTTTEFWLNGQKITLIMTDTALAGATNNQLVTAKAVKDYIGNRPGGGGGSDNWGSQVVQKNTTLTGTGVTGNLLGVATDAIDSTRLATNAVQSTDIGNGQVWASDLSSNAVTTAKILDANVTLAKLAAGSVDSTKLITGAVQSTDIADGQVWASDLSTNSVTTIKILDASVTLAKLAANSVDSTKIAAGAIQSTDIGNGQVWLADLSSNSVDSTKIVASAVRSSDIGDGQVWTADLGSAVVTMVKINQAGAALNDVIKWNGSAWAASPDVGGGSGDNWGSQAVNITGTTTLSGNGTVATPLLVPTGGITATEIATDGVAAAEIATGAVGTSELGDGTVALIDLAAGSVDSTKIVASAVQNTDIADGQVWRVDLGASVVDSTKLAVGSVQSTDIANGQVWLADLSNNSVDSTKLVAGAVQSTDIADGQVWRADLSNNSVDSTKLITGSVQSTDIADGQVWGADIANNAINSSKIADNSVNGTDIALGSDAQGDVMFYDGTNWSRLAAATAAWVLKTNSTGANPAWAPEGDASTSNELQDLSVNTLTDSTIDVRISTQNTAAIFKEGTGIVMVREAPNIIRVSTSGGGGGGSLSGLTPATATNTINNLNFDQVWNWSTEDTGSALSFNGNALTTGSLLNLKTSNNSIKTPLGVLNVENSGTSVAGYLARFQSNSTAGNGLFVRTIGYVGVGTDNPKAPFTVSTGDSTLAPLTNAVVFATGVSSTPAIVQVDAFSTGLAGAGFYGRHARGSSTTPTALGSGDIINELAGAGYHSGSAFGNTVGSIRIRANEAFTGTAQGTNIGFLTTADGATAPLERFTMRADGTFVASGYTATGALYFNDTNVLTNSKVLITPPATTATLALANNSTLATSGAFSITLTATAATNVTLPTTGTLATLAGTETLTNKAITKRVSTVANGAAPTPNASTDDMFTITAQNIASTIGTPGAGTNGQSLVIRIKDNGTARGITWNTVYRFSVDLPAFTTTIANATHYAYFIYNTAEGKWDQVGKMTF